MVCFFIAKSYRRRGVAGRLLQAALDYVRDCGGRIVEGYPVEPRKSGIPDPFAYHGLASMFRSAGFKEVARRSETRPIVRYVMDSDGQWDLSDSQALSSGPVVCQVRH